MINIYPKDSKWYVKIPDESDKEFNNSDDAVAYVKANATKDNTVPTRTYVLSSEPEEE
tara:strand:- start:283 stop:456 length:174 start_codon:yes stop_codon:yes gene_type:complete